MTKNTAVRGGETVTEERYFISSLPVQARESARAIRSHWMAESCRRHLDVTFREDANHTLDKAAAYNLNISCLAASLIHAFVLGPVPHTLGIFTQIQYTLIMKITGSRRLLPFLAAFLFAGGFPVSGADTRSAALEVNLIIDGSASFAAVANTAQAWISEYLLEKRLQPGDRITVWSAGGKAEVLYSNTLKNEAEKAAVKEILGALPAKGNAADFAGALRDAASQSSGKNITYTLLISSSQPPLSPALSAGNAGPARFSRIEEFPGWRVMTVALNINDQVRRAAAAYFSGN